MTDLSSLAVVKELLDSAEQSVHRARTLLSEMVSDSTIDSSSFVKKASSVTAAPSVENGQRIIEGVFDGQYMVDSDGRTYPVPANYASKSKLVSGDHLKLTITEDGRFLYKQIGPVERKHLVGPLTHEDGQYKILTTTGKAYKVLLASVTFFRAEIGDEVTILVPENENTEWAAIEAVLPKIQPVVAIDKEDTEKKDEE